MSKRRAVIFINPSRAEAVKAAEELASILTSKEFELVTPTDVAIKNIEQVAIDEIGVVEVAEVGGGAIIEALQGVDIAIAVEVGQG